MATLVLEHSDDSGSDRLGEALRDRGHRLRVVRLQAGDALPADLAEIDGVLVCGGSPCPIDGNLPWLESEMQLLRDAHEADVPIVGICFGNQVLTRALGGIVDKLDSGPEVGWHEVTLSAIGREDPVFAGIAWQSIQAHWHSYHVTQVAPDARVLASSQRSPVQAWALGLRTYGFQYHPEIEADTLERWARSEPETMQEAGLTMNDLAAQTKEHYPTFARLGERLFDHIAGLVLPVDRRFQGLASHH
jgi:GMP synthase-like glutamine amidotransferase